MILQPGIHCPSYEARDLGPHPPLHRQLSDGHGRESRLAGSQSFELTAVRLIWLASSHLDAQRSVSDLGSQLLMIADLDHVLDAWHEG
jgi:hypothetical protein